MTDYIAIDESETNPFAPSRSSLWKRWSKNWIAGFEGAAGAPRLRFAALDGAISTAGGIGSYVFAKGGSDAAFGATVAGSTLQPTSAAYSVTIGGGSTVTTFVLGSALSGTWRCMGVFDAAGAGTGAAMLGATLWLRIA